MRGHRPRLQFKSEFCNTLCKGTSGQISLSDLGYTSGRQRIARIGDALRSGLWALSFGEVLIPTFEDGICPCQPLSIDYAPAVAYLDLVIEMCDLFAAVNCHECIVNP